MHQNEFEILSKKLEGVLKAIKETGIYNLGMEEIHEICDIIEGYLEKISLKLELE